MRLLLDTCTFLWVILDAAELTPMARALIMAPENEIFLSVVSSWEIAVKAALGRIALPQSPDRYVPLQRAKHSIEFLPLQEEAALHVGRLPPLHKDPFDRMLVCQAIVHGMAIVGPDPLLAQYQVRCLW